ncbi:MAG: ABC transporter permease [Bacteroidales bacterium]|nr:ABC transporter permease [Bacteroidales bacterium]
MNIELFIAKRLFFKSDNEKSISKPIIKIAITGISLGLAVMILAVAIVTGFKSEIRNKVIGFGSHIQIVNYDSNYSYETKSINKKQPFLPILDSIYGIKHYQIFATKAGIIKTDADIQVVILKGIGSDFDWSFFKTNLVEGKTFIVNDSVKSNKIIISKYIADLLKLKIDDNIAMYFAQNPPRVRKFNITGIYETSLEELDRVFVLVDISHIQKLNDWTKDQISGFEILINNFDKLDNMTDIVNDIAGFQFNEDGSKLKVVSIKDKFPQIFSWLKIQDMNVWVILVLMVIVAGFNMVSGLLILILERTNMIGILKGFGTQNWSIRKMFLYIASFLTAKGLFWGNLVGILICVIQNNFGIIKLDPASYYVSTVPINLEISHLLLLNLGTLLITLLMLIIPSYIVTKISPVDAIRFN